MLQCEQWKSYFLAWNSCLVKRWNIERWAWSRCLSLQMLRRWMSASLFGGVYKLSSPNTHDATYKVTHTYWVLQKKVSEFAEPPNGANKIAQNDPQETRLQVRALPDKDAKHNGTRGNSVFFRSSIFWSFLRNFRPSDLWPTEIKSGPAPPLAFLMIHGKTRPILVHNMDGMKKTRLMWAETRGCTRGSTWNPVQKYLSHRNLTVLYNVLLKTKFPSKKWNVFRTNRERCLTRPNSTWLKATLDIKVNLGPVHSLYAWCLGFESKLH